LAEADLHHALLDAVDIEMAVVNPDGTIQYTNAAWQRCAQAMGASAIAGVAVGANYLAHLATGAGRGEVVDQEISAGLRTVIDGDRDDFELEFSRTTATGARWYLMRATPLSKSAPRAVAVTHLDISHIRLVTEGVLTSQYDSVRHEQQQREVSSLETMATHSTTSVTAAVYGKLPIRESAIAAFGMLVSRYGQMLERAVENRVYRSDGQQTEDLRELAQQLRFLNAGPRDVIDVHLTAVKVALRRGAERAAAPLLEEARPLALQLMGELLSIYRLEAVASRNHPQHEAS